MNTFPNWLWQTDAWHSASQVARWRADGAPIGLSGGYA